MIDPGFGYMKHMCPYMLDNASQHRELSSPAENIGIALQGQCHPLGDVSHPKPQPGKEEGGAASRCSAHLDQRYIVILFCVI